MDLIPELQSYSIEAKVHDPAADAAEAKYKYGLDLASSDLLHPTGVLVLAGNLKAAGIAVWRL